MAAGRPWPNLASRAVAAGADGRNARSRNAAGRRRLVRAPLAPHAASGDVLLVAVPREKMPQQPIVEWAPLATALGSALLAARTREHQRRRIERLEAILEIASQWNQTHEMEPLLVQMAEAATRLLGADRASIFLWDRPNHTLVGRPALGVEGGELRIPDDSRRGRRGDSQRRAAPRRCRRRAATQIDRHVDRATPLPDPHAAVRAAARPVGGELFGAFELINKLAGDVSPRRTKRRWSSWPPTPPWPWKTPRTAEQLLSANRQIAEQAAEKVRLIGESPAIEALRSIIRRVADTDLAVLILGENGTGKEVVAQSIHYLSRRRDQPFVAVNCAAIPETLAESELFGHEKGRLHRRPREPAGQVRAGRRRHAVSRRDRRPEPQRPGEAACACWRRKCWSAWAARRRSTPTPGCWPPRIRTWPRWSGRSGSARISISA